MKHLLYIICLSLLPFLLHAQSPSIQGSITSQEGPVEFVNVLLLKASDSTLVKAVLSDNMGSFKIDQIEANQYLIHASMLGYNKVYSEAFNFDQKNDVKVLPLNLSEGIQMEEIAITSKKAFIEMSADKMTINVANSPVAVGNSALDVLKKAPGVSLDNENKISLRGKNGTLVMINGKQQYLSSEALSEMLANMPASNIQKIEMITNPSAKYEAAGNSGIINIILKKNENLGLNGTVGANLTQNMRTSHSENLRLNYRNARFNLFGSADYSDRRRRKTLGLERTIIFEDNITDFKQNTLQLNDSKIINAMTGMDITVSPSTTFGLVAMVNTTKDLEDDASLAIITGSGAPTFSRLIVDSRADENYMSYNFSSSLQHEFNDKGFHVSWDSDYNRITDQNVIHYDNFFQNDEEVDLLAPYYLKNQQETAISIFASKVDFTLPLTKQHTLEFGGKFSSVITDNNTEFESLQNAEWIHISEKSNQFNYHEQVLAFYSSISGSLGQYKYQLGLRAEQTVSIGKSLTLGQENPRSYLDFFPSLNLSRNFASSHDVSFSYSRRLDRPNYKSLNPFEYYLDEFTFSKGNPFLNPQYTHNLSANYGYNNQFFATFEYSHTSDAITDVIEQISAENKTFQTSQNLSTFNNAYLALSAPKVWAEWLTSRFDYTAYYSQYYSVVPSGILDKSNLAHFFSINNEVQLPNDWNLEVSGEYQTEVVVGLFSVAPMGSLDLGLSKSLMNNRVQLSINVNDLLFTDYQRVSVQQDDINMNVLQKRDTRKLNVSLRYNFGNQKVKAAKQRSGAAREESRRL